jgi:hypothetical protein
MNFLDICLAIILVVTLIGFLSLFGYSLWKMMRED